MSGEANDWRFTKMREIVLGRGLADDITSVCQDPLTGWPCFVEGVKNNQPVRFEVFYDTDFGEWCCERREMMNGR